MDPEQCSICNEPFTDEEIKANIRHKGLQTLIEKSKKIQDEKWKEWEKLDKQQSVVVHEGCRKRYQQQCDKPLSERKRPKLADPTNDDVDEPPAKPFDYQTLCMLCDKLLDTNHKKVLTLNPQIEQTPIIEWSKSTDDEHAKEIIRRIRYLRNNVNIAGRYHQSCRHKCRKSEPYVSKIDKVAIEKAFESVTNYIESSGEYKFEISTFRKIMDESDVEPLSEHVLSRKLEEKYGNDIFIERHIGRPPLYFYKTNPLFENSSEWLANPQSLSDFDKSILIKLAADIIKHEVLHKHYESNNDSSGERPLSTPSSALETFTDRLLEGTSETDKNVKRDSINQTIIRAVRLKKFHADPAPKKIVCYCVGDCSTSRCTCKKISSKCSELCKNCNNQSCSNYPVAHLPVEVEHENGNENVIVEFLINDEINLTTTSYTFKYTS